MSGKKINRILLTGMPGIGKTTAVQTVCNMLKQKNVPVIGFYTKEVRDSAHTRIGFDIVTLDGKTGVLARAKSKTIVDNPRHTIGNYAVFVDEFESLVMPLLKQQKPGVIFVIDEIGKMELFSRTFEKTVMDLFNTPNITIIATIPVIKIKPIPIIEKLKNFPFTITITVDRSNRDKIPGEVLSFIDIN